MARGKLHKVLSPLHLYHLFISSSSLLHFTFYTFSLVLLVSLISDEIYGGEDYNANMEEAGWDMPNFNDTNWTPVDVVPGPAGVLTPIGNGRKRGGRRGMEEGHASLLKSPF